MLKFFTALSSTFKRFT